MRIFNLLVYILLFNFTFIHAATEDWSVADMEDSKIWLHKSNPDVTGSIQILKRKEPLNWNTINKDSFYKNFESQKKKSLSLIGVRTWNVSSYKFETKNGLKQLTIEGSYTDHRGNEVVFKELHIFKRHETIQTLHTRPVTLKDDLKYEDDFFTIALQEMNL
jgi:hypothetical protein